MRGKYLFIWMCVFGFCVQGSAEDCPQIKYVVFDFGGVVANVDKSQIVKFLMDSFPISIYEAEHALGAWGLDLRNKQSENDFWLGYADSLGVTLPQGWLKGFHEAEAQSLVSIKETLEVIKALQSQGYPTGMLSNVTSEHAAIIRELGYYDLFNPVLLSYQIGADKPDLEAYRILLKNLPVPAEQVLFVDDQNRNVIAARKLGINAIHLTRPEYLMEQFAEYCIYLNQPAQAGAGK